MPSQARTRHVYKGKRISKKGQCVLCKAARVKYLLIEEFRGEYLVRLMCRVLEAPASFYRWRNRSESGRSRRRAFMEEKVKGTFATYKAHYDVPRVTHKLNALGVPCSLNFVANTMHKQGIRARNGKAFIYGPRTVAMSNVAENLLRRWFGVDKPNQRWTSNID